MTITDSGNAIFSHWSNSQFIFSDGSGEIFRWQMTGSEFVEGLPVSGVTFSPGKSCSDVIEKELTITTTNSGLDTCEPTLNMIFPDNPNVPTIGQWGLICLGLLLVSVGIVSIKQKIYQE